MAFMEYHLCGLKATYTIDSNIYQLIDSDSELRYQTQNCS